MEDEYYYKRREELRQDSTVMQIIERELAAARASHNVGRMRQVDVKAVDKRRKAAKVARKQRKRNR